MKLRFVTGDDFISRLILLREGSMSPWVKYVPSHVELVVQTRGVTGYLGAHDDGGVQIRPVGYDKSYLKAERFVDVIVPDEAAAEKFARSKIGEPYDFAAILDLAAPAPLNWHLRRHCICSAFMTQTAAKGGLFVSTSPVTKAMETTGIPSYLGLPPHLVSPALLLFWLSGKVPIPEAIAY